MTDTSISTNPTSFAGFETVLAEVMPGYEPRPQQQELARGIEGFFAYSDNFSMGEVPLEGEKWTHPDRHHFLGHAPCGTGKTVAYLAPAICSNKRVIVSVTTKALQDQLVDKDLPFLAEHFDFTWAMLKGRGNYVCLNRAETAEPSDAPFLPDLMAYLLAHPENDGLRETLPIRVTDSQWARINGESDDCSANHCSLTPERCFATKARMQAQEARIVVVNHALFCTDLQITHQFGAQGMLSEYDAVIFDEAHELAEVARQSLGTKFSEATFSSLAAQIRNWAARYSTNGEGPFEATVTRMAGVVPEFFRSLSVGRVREATFNNDTLLDAYTEIIDSLDSFAVLLKNADVSPDADDRERARKQRDRLKRRVYSTRTRFASVLTDGWNESVRWVEEENFKGQTRKILQTCPIEVAPILSRWLFNDIPCTLVSGTIAVDGSFEFITRELGIENYRSIVVDTPFDFPNQARLYVPVHLPQPLQSMVPVWESGATNEIVSLVNASRGRALVLFTSVKHMKSTFEMVRRLVQYPIKMQGDGESNKALADWFRSETDAVLFGTKSFMTGLDVQGESCSLVIISKLPFPVPSEPLIEAKCEILEAKERGSSFRDFVIPSMSLTLQQAAGRLIRHRDDTGVVAILDPRIIAKGYGKQIVRDLPNMPTVTKLADVEDFFAA